MELEQVLGDVSSFLFVMYEPNVEELGHQVRAGEHGRHLHGAAGEDTRTELGNMVDNFMV